MQFRRPRFDSWVRKISWRRKWQPTPVFLPRKSHGWRSLVGYSPWGHKESDTMSNFMEEVSSILAWRIPWTEEPGKLQSIALQESRVGHDLETKTRECGIKYLIT